jgi:NAD(P)-dependent dehydrogenase (short-subunit alcohol dehydrogenase family)
MSKDVVVITGGAGGIGSVCGYKLDGYKLVIADFNKEALDSAVQKMLSAGIDAVGFESDITDQNSVNALVTFTKELGTFKGLIHTAGVSGTVKDAKRVFTIDLVATDMLINAFYEIAEAKSVVVLFASMMGHVVPPNSEYDKALMNPQSEEAWATIEPFIQGNSDFMYNFAKRGVILLAKQNAMRYGKKGARIVSVSPGVIMTPMAQKALEEHPEIMKQTLDMTPAGRYGQPEDIAETVKFLLSDAASFITGTDIIIDGGVLTQMLK